MSNPTITDKREKFPYVTIKHALIDACILDSFEMALYVALSRYVNYQTGLAFPSHSRLQKMLQCGKNRLLKSISGLEEKGLLEVHRTAGEVNHYDLLDYQPVPVANGVVPVANTLPVCVEDTKKKKIVNISTKKDSAPAQKADAISSNGASPQSPPIANLEHELDTDYIPNTAHKVLFEFIADKWHLAKRRKDGKYRSEINGQFGEVAFAHIQRTIGYVKRVFGDKVKPDTLQEYVTFYEQKCGSNIRLPQGEAALMRSVLEWQTHKRRFSVDYDPYEDLIPDELKGK